MGGPNSGKTSDTRTVKGIKRVYKRGANGKGARTTGRLLGISPQTMRNIAKGQKNELSVLNRPRGHRKRKLTDEDVKKIKSHPSRNPSTTNQKLANIVLNKVSPRTISNYLLRSHPPYTTKQYLNQEPEEITPSWQDRISNFLKNVVRWILISKRVDADETPVYSNLASKYDRAPRGIQPKRPLPRYSKKYTLYVFAKKK